MAVEKIYMVGYAAIGNSENTGIRDHYIEGKGMVAGMTVPKVWNYRVPAVNADEARYNAWKLFLKDFYKDSPIGKVDSHAWLKPDDYSTPFKPVYCYVDKRASSGSVGKTDDGESRNIVLAERSKRKRTRRMRRAGKKSRPRTIAGQDATEFVSKSGYTTTCKTTKMEIQDAE